MDKPLNDRFSLPPMPHRMVNKDGQLTEAAVEWYKRVNAIAQANQQPKDKDKDKDKDKEVTNA